MRASTIIAVLFVAQCVAWPQSAAVLPPPVAPVRPVIDDYFGTKVTDPYRYMEDLESDEVQQWLRLQNDYARAILAKIPGRQALLDRIGALQKSSPALTSNVRHYPGDVYFYLKFSADEDVARLYTRRGLHGEERLVADPTKILLAPANRSKGAAVIFQYTPSWDLKYVALTLLVGGAEHDMELHVVETATGKETGDIAEQAEPPDFEDRVPFWLPDNRSIVYGRHQKLSPDAPVIEQQQKYRSYLHVLGTDSARDKPVFGYGAVASIDIDPNHYSWAVAEPDSKFVLGFVDAGTMLNKALYIEPIQALGGPHSAWSKVADFSDDVKYAVVHGDDLYLLSYKGAPRYKILRTSARNPDLLTAETVVPSGEAVVTGMFGGSDALYVQLLDGGVDHLLRIPYGTGPKTEHVALPFEGGIEYAYADPRVPGAILAMTSWTRSSRIYSWDRKSRRVVDTGLQPPGPNDDPAGIETKEVKVRSQDGTLIPLSIVAPKDLKRDASHAAHLTGYGNYGNVERPFFNPLMIALYERGGIFATCHARGGGEYGEEWHAAGKGANKANSWRDFIACAEYLVAQGYTSPAHMSCMGVSGGGILVGRAATERPDLFAAVIDWVGVTDMLRLETMATGAANIPEFGSVKTESGFHDLYAMSAYHHVKDGVPYPAFLITTGINDPRVDPWQPAKMAARLQAATSSGKPVLLRVDYAGGHGNIGNTASQFDELLADTMSFEFWQLGVPEFQPHK